jgi:two-component system sensor histidine kinase PilS (NtrC family)
MFATNDGAEPRDVILGRIKWLMSVRLVLATFSLGTAALIQMTEGKPLLDPFLSSLYLIIGIIYALNLLYATVLRKVERLRIFIYIQLFTDLLLITGLINATGGVRSVFSLFYYLSIIAASIMLYRKGGIIIASASSILFTIILFLEPYKIFQPFYILQEGETASSASLAFGVVMNITGFYLIALLSSFLSEQVRRSNEALKIKEIDYHKLETLYRNIIESINSGLLTVDKDNRIIYFNRAAEQITGYAFSEIRDATIDEVFPELQEVEEDTQQFVNYDGLQSRFQISFKMADGKIRYLGFSKSILKDSEGDILGEVYAFQDVTRLKEMEEQVKLVDRLAAIGRLATGMAHEIRNPLASMSGSIQVLGESLQLDAANKRLMDIVLRETDRLDQLLSDFLLFTHPDDRKKQMIELNSIIDDTVQLFSYNPNYNTIEVVKNLQGSIMIEVDTQQIKQVLWNLFINAAQAMGNGGELTVSTSLVHFDALAKGIQARLDRGVGNLWSQIVVADTGSGIPESYLDKVFDPFFTSKERGIGLGLAIVFRIVESYQGVILVKSEKSSGTSFTIFLPSVSTG